MKITPLFAWYDLWIGAFWDRKTRKLYILPLPCIGFVFQFGPINPVLPAVSLASSSEVQATHPRPSASINFPVRGEPSKE